MLIQKPLLQKTVYEKKGVFLKTNIKGKSMTVEQFKKLAEDKNHALPKKCQNVISRN